MSCFSFLRVIATALILTIASTTNPFQLNTSSQSYGPDGPWQAISIAIGEGQGPIDLFPGGWASSLLLTSTECSQGSQCAAAGIYNPNVSDSTFDAEGSLRPSTETYYLGVIDLDYTYQVGLDSLTLSSPSLVVAPVSVPDFKIALASNLEMTIGKGVPYPLQAGQLALGPSPLILSGNESLIPGKLEAQNDIPSSSFGLHYGSAALGQKLSVWLGGYDQQRLVGPVSTQNVDANDNLSIDLLDIGIGVESGGSPFPFPSKQGLLANNNASIGSSLTVVMNPYSPYLALPSSTCNAIAALLPVTYNASLDLYLWDTTDPKYEPIITSPSFLNFTFRLSGSSNSNITVNIPFALLNLTLNPPLVPKSTQYLPCQPPTTYVGYYSLGRAFMQGAFLGADWDKTPSEWYLAQAPGPNVASQPDPVAIGNTTTVTSSTNVWGDTWKDIWKPLAADASSPSNSTATPVPPPGGLSGGAIAGIVIGVLIGVGALIAGALFLYIRRRRRGRGLENQPMMAEQQQQEAFPYQHSKPLGFRSEMDGGKNISEMGSKQDLQEMPVTGPEGLLGRETIKGHAELEDESSTRGATHSSKAAETYA